MPDVASVPAKATVRAWLYQPFASGGRDAAALTAGAVLSSLIVTVLLVPSPPLLAVHVIFVPGVSVIRVCVPQPVEVSSPVTVQLTVTLLRYQPFNPSVPVMVTVISGGTATALGAPPRTAATTAQTKTSRREIPRRPRRRSNFRFPSTDAPLLPRPQPRARSYYSYTDVSTGERGAGGNPPLALRSSVVHPVDRRGEHRPLALGIGSVERIHRERRDPCRYGGVRAVGDHR